MPGWGLTPAGFVVKPLANILSDMQAQVWATIDPNLDLSAQTPDGQMIAIFANAVASNWELAQIAYNQYNREDTEGAGLDNVGELTGSIREGASFTQVLCTLTISAADAPYPTGTLVANVAGFSGQSFANLYPLVASQISGGTAIVLMQAQTIGEVPFVNDGTLTNITTPVTGWSAINNPGPNSQTQTGTNSELDPAFAQRQVEELSAEGSCNPAATAEAIIAAGAAQAPPVTLTVLVVENTGSTGMAIQGLVLPPHTYGVVIYDGGSGWASSTIGKAILAQALWNNKPAGITQSSLGAVQVVYADPILGNQTLYYFIPAGLPLFITAHIVVRQQTTLANVAPAIRSALVAAAVAPTPANGVPAPGQLVPGGTVYGSQLEAVIQGVPGVQAVTTLTFGFSASPSFSTPLTLQADEIATILGATAPTNIVILSP